MNARRLDLGDAQMAHEMFMASPDGQAEQRRIQALVDALPDGRVSLDGHFGLCGDEWPGHDQ